MMFLLRAAFWLCVVILLLPGDPDRPANAPSVTVLELLTAARTAVADLGQMCDRNPDLCETGGEVAQVLADKARYGIEQLQAFLDRQAVEGNTLTPEDTAVPWQDPLGEPRALADARP